MQRAEMLAEIMADKKGVAVSGTHGKTTTTSMVASVLDAGGFAPTVLIGGEVNDLGANARLGAGDVVVAEADESDASFLRLTPSCAIITNIENDHLGYYRDLEHLIETFLAFARRVPASGSIIASADCTAVQEVLRRFRIAPQLLRRSAHRHGRLRRQPPTCAPYSVELADFGSRFTVERAGVALGEISMRVPGSINVFNGLCAIAVGLRIRRAVRAIACALGRFRGVARRFQVLYESPDRSSSSTTTRITRPRCKRRSPPRARTGRAGSSSRSNRTATAAPPISSAISRARCPRADLIVGDATSTPRAKCRCRACAPRSIVECIREIDAEKPVMHLPKCADVLAYLQRSVRNGDLVLTLGAGDIGGVAHELGGGAVRVRRGRRLAAMTTVRLAQSPVPGTARPGSIAARFRRCSTATSRLSFRLRNARRCAWAATRRRMRKVKRVATARRRA